jgi:hypothetical protein
MLLLNTVRRQKRYTNSIGTVFMDFSTEGGNDTPFWNGVSEAEPLVEKKWEDMTRTERDEHLLQYDEMIATKTDTSRKNIGIAGFFYIMAFIMFFTELRIVSLLHCIFGTLFMFFYKIGIQVGE